MTNQVIDPILERKKPAVVPKPPQLLRAEEPSLLTSLRNNLRDVLFPEKLPPLQVSSRPVAVRDIWEARDPKKTAATSLTIHALAIAGVVFLTMAGPKVVKEVQKQTITYIPSGPQELPMMKVAKESAGGGGGGGAREKIQAPKGKLPKVTLEQQITPPTIVVRNEHPKLEAEPTVMASITPMNNNLPTIGDVTSKVAGPASNGTGIGGGIGDGRGTGVGIGTGSGYGKGSGGNTGGGVFKVGGGVQAPKAIYSPDPEYSEEARKAKYQGEVVLWLIVDQYGRPQNVRVLRSPGMGLDQKAIEAVKLWKFDPATKDGKPVAVQINVEVNFRLY
jgi:protein TonB